MKLFAKVFEVNNRQLLVKKAKNDEMAPKLSLIMQFDDAEVDLGVMFPDTDEGEALRDKAFDDFDEVAAFNLTAKVKGCDSAFEAATAMLGKAH